MLKRKITALFCSIFVLVSFVTINVSAETPAKSVDTTTPPAVTITGKSAIVVEQSTGKILYENNAHEKLYPASLTKIMTELLVLEAIESGRIKFDDKITCSEHAASMGGSDIWLEPGEVMTVSDLFKAMAVNSANDAAVALGEKIAGSETAFVKMMNDKAKTLSMNDTNFDNCTGLDDDTNLTSAYDVMLISKELIKHKDIFNYCTIWMDTLRDGKTTLYNTNKLIRFYDGANGLKTGSTNKAGYCLSATAMRDNMQLIAVVMDCPTLNDRFNSAENLLDYGFANWSRVSPKLINNSVSIKVLHGEKTAVDAVAEDSPSILTEKGKENGIVQKINYVPNVMAPVVKDQVVGQITFWVDGVNVGSVPLKAKENVDRLTFFKAISKLFIHLIQ